MKIALVYLTFIVCAVHAEVLTFTNEAEFVNSLNSFVTHDLDEFDPNTILTNQIAGLQFQNSLVRVGNQGGAFESPVNVILNNDRVSPIVIDFTERVTAFGLFNTSLVDAERFEIFDSLGELLGSIDLPDQAVNFGGFTSDIAIARAVITPIAPTNGSIFIDTLTVGIATVPEPSTYILITFLLLVTLIKRQKIQQNLNA